ncbi:spore coat protein YsxE [Shouchella lonarensis]|uniref:Spore coat protein YsxE n=1 Tax=Shouchella lonarensis TaxID=1464122 RepID=A0A1G6JZV1_9BACI|nr:spore coat protein YsxE [Shouchella lonarensis]SDC24111.1 spore coat protein YsxE [Shouchella lonarensis]
MKQIYEAILFYYDLQPIDVEDRGKIKKVTTDRGTFALKETEMTRLQADEFIHALRKLSKQAYRQFVPVLPTKFGEYTIIADAHCYYLMPWIEQVAYTDRVTMEEKIADQMGVIHRLTVQTEEVSREQLDASCERLLTRWEERMDVLKQFARRAEEKNYIAPFELSFLTHFVMFEQLYKQAQSYLEKWYEATVEKGTYRSVLTHGRMSRHHTLFNEKNEPLLLNFEQASLDTPARDLASFCRHSFPFSLWSEDAVFRWLHCYEQHLPLLDSEKQLTCAYMMYPEPIYYAVHDYIENASQKQEVDHVKRLEKRVIALRKVQRLVPKFMPQEQYQETETT